MSLRFNLSFGLTLLVEIFNQVRVENIFSFYPRPFFRAVAFPINKILETAPDTFGVQDLFDCVHLLSVDDTWRWRWLGQGDKGRGSNGFNLGNMECRVNAHGRGKLELNINGAYNLDNGKGADEPGGELLAGVLELEVLGGEPDALAHLVGRRL